MRSLARRRSVDAIVTAVAIPCTISLANDGPETKATGWLSPRHSGISSDMTQRVEVSMPLERETTGTSGSIRCATFPSASREYCTGTAWKMKSAVEKASSGLRHVTKAAAGRTGSTG